MELGVYTFGDRVPHLHTAKLPTAEQRMQQMLGLAKLCDELGLDIFGVGEHHGLNYVNSSTATMIAAMAAVTKRIRLTSASTLLSTADPVRTFQEFATADLVSKGRVEIIFGRGAFTDNFPLFGADIQNYDALFAEKLDLFARLNASDHVTWSGRFRPSLDNAAIAPRPSQTKLPVWIGALSQASVERAARLQYPLVMPMLGGTIDHHAAMARYYRQVWRDSGHREEPRIAIFAHLHVTETARETEQDFYRYYSAYLQPLFKGPIPPSVYEQMLSPNGTLIGGSVEQVSEKLLRIKRETGAIRFVGQIDIGGQSTEDVNAGVLLYANSVAASVR